MPDLPSQQALDMLIDEHRSVQRLFTQFEKEDDRAIKEEIVRTACREITMHAALEEELFYPIVQDAIKDPDLIDEATVEHASARQLIEQLDRMTADHALFEATFKVLGEYLNHHIREEEETMFAEVRRTRLDLEAIGGLLTERRSQWQAIDAAEAA